MVCITPGQTCLLGGDGKFRRPCSHPLVDAMMRAGGQAGGRAGDGAQEAAMAQSDHSNQSTTAFKVVRLQFDGLAMGCAIGRAVPGILVAPQLRG